MNTRNLETDVRARLIHFRGEWHAIAEQSGVSHSWISKFVNHKIPNPGFRTLVRISDWLDAREASASRPAVVVPAAEPSAAAPVIDIDQTGDILTKQGQAVIESLEKKEGDGRG